MKTIILLFILTFSSLNLFSQWELITYPLGQKLIEKEIFGTSTINTNDLQTGMYVIKLESGGGVVFEKVIVNR